MDFVLKQFCSLWAQYNWPHCWVLGSGILQGDLKPPPLRIGRSPHRFWSFISKFSGALRGLFCAQSKPRHTVPDPLKFLKKKRHSKPDIFLGFLVWCSGVQGESTNVPTLPTAGMTSIEPYLYSLCSKLCLRRGRGFIHPKVKGAHWKPAGKHTPIQERPFLQLPDDPLCLAQHSMKSNLRTLKPQMLLSGFQVWNANLPIQYVWAVFHVVLDATCVTKNQAQKRLQENRYFVHFSESAFAQLRKAFTSSVQRRKGSQICQNQSTIVAPRKCIFLWTAVNLNCNAIWACNWGLL